MNIANLMSRAGHIWPGNLALAQGTRAHARYGELAARVAAIAGGMTARLGAAPDQRVALIMGNGPRTVEALFAIWHAGLVAVPIDASLHKRELTRILDHSGASICFVGAEVADTVAGLADDLPQLNHVIGIDERDYAALSDTEPMAPVARAPDDLAWLFTTGGTTGQPKVAMLTHRNLLAATQAYFTDVDAVAPSDCMLHAAPMSHGSGIYILPHVARGAAQVTPAGDGFDAAEIFDLAAHYSGATLFASPAMVKRLTSHGGGGGADGLKTIVYGGGPMRLADLKAAHERFGHRLAQVYGQAECPMTITVMPKAMHEVLDRAGDDGRLASAGVPFTGMELIIADGDDTPLPQGAAGEVLVRGAAVMRGYWRAPEVSAEALRGGWLHTGDVGVLDGAGYLTLKDRALDLIVSGGADIFAREVEDVLLSHEGVAEAAVLGRAHPDWGEEAVAFVVARGGARLGADVLDEHCLGHLARHKRPRRYLFVDALPKNSAGKIVKAELKAQLLPAAVG